MRVLSGTGSSHKKGGIIIPDKSDLMFTLFIAYGVKLLNADWLTQRAFSLNHEGTFGNQEGMIT